jgi:hypothetical protein
MARPARSPVSIGAAPVGDLNDHRRRVGERLNRHGPKLRECRRCNRGAEEKRKRFQQSGPLLRRQTEENTLPQLVNVSSRLFDAKSVMLSPATFRLALRHPQNDVAVALAGAGLLVCDVTAVTAFRMRSCKTQFTPVSSHNGANLAPGNPTRRGAFSTFLFLLRSPRSAIVWPCREPAPSSYLTSAPRR